MKVLKRVQRTLKTQLWWSVTVLVILTVMEVTSLSGPNVCMVKQMYNITKRVKYRAPMSVRTYEWCFAVPPRCSKWNTEMRDVTRLETEERTAEMAVCCPGYKLKDVSCVPICPNGKTGHSCSEDCPPNKWGPNCVHDCKKCEHGVCDVTSGDCRCQDGWQGERCETSMSTTAAVVMMEQLLTTARSIASTKTNEQNMPIVITSRTPVTTTDSTTTSVSSTSSHITMPEQTKPSFIGSTDNVSKPLPTTVATVLFTKEKIQEPFTRKFDPTQDVFTFPNNVTLYGFSTTLETYKIIAENDYKRRVLDKFNFRNNRTEFPFVIPTLPTPTKTTLAMKTEATTLKEITPKTQLEITTSKPSTKVTFPSKPPEPTTVLTTVKESTVTKVPQETRKTETTIKQSSTTKFKHKEIWIRPAQKGETTVTETKLKPTQELHHTNYKSKEFSEATTPKTIIVSIIPTSVSYVTFKKLALSTASSIPQKYNPLTTKSNRKSTNQGYTKPTVIQTTPYTVKVQERETKSSMSSTIIPLLKQNETTAYSSTTRSHLKATLPTIQTTNSMSSTLNAANKRMNSTSLISVSSFPTNVTRTTRKYYALEISTSKFPLTAPSKNLISSTAERTTTDDHSTRKQYDPVMQISTTVKPLASGYTEVPKITKTLMEKAIKEADTNIKKNLTNYYHVTVSDNPTSNEETFHVLTEPEHITAVMGDKETERSTIDLISVISIAGGVMMAIITVAVVIVMLERCKKPRYEEVRKYNDINMQVIIDNNDMPPPYVRSIFHTPLPDPPTTLEKCHYQPITTLDRNLKQFMRPVVVQTISPLMLENFRGILECHYDHLPRRSQDMGTMPARCSVTPSINDTTKLLPRRGHSLTDFDIEALKCEAKLDVIDNTTSEPLYAEIPCWRPPSAHAIEIVNVNGEAVTEL